MALVDVWIAARVHKAPIVDIGMVDLRLGADLFDLHITQHLVTLRCRAAPRTRHAELRFDILGIAYDPLRNLYNVAEVDACLAGTSRRRESPGPLLTMLRTAKRVSGRT